MANVVGNWDNGMPTGLGSANGSRPYPRIKFHWNVGSGTDHAELESPNLEFPLRGDCINFLVNTEGANVNTANVVLNIKGSADGTNYFTLDTVTINSANFDQKLYIHKYDVSTNGLAPYMKIGLDPASNLGVNAVIYVGVFNSQHAH